MKSYIWKLIIFTIALETFAIAQAATIVQTTNLTFDNPPMGGSPYQTQDGYGINNSFIEGDYVFRMDPSLSSPYSAFIRYFSPYPAGGFGGFLVPDSGSVHVGILYECFPFLARMDGKPFDLKSLRYGEYSIYATSATFNLTGTHPDGTIVSASLPMDQIFDGPGGVEDFQTSTFDSSWKNLTKVIFTSQATSVDDITVNYNITTNTALPKLSIYSIDRKAKEDEDDALLRIHRTGPLTQPLSVRVLLGGNATFGTDYKFKPAGTLGIQNPDFHFFTIPAGSRTLDVKLIPVDNQSKESAENVSIKLTPRSTYQVDSKHDHIRLLILDDKGKVKSPHRDDHFRGVATHHK